MNDYSTGSTHPDCIGDTDVCPDRGCKSCQGQEYDNLIRGRIVFGDGTTAPIYRMQFTKIED